MLGYRCCSNIDVLPEVESNNLFRKKTSIFDAYVDIGSLDTRYVDLANLYPSAKFIVTVGNAEGERNIIPNITQEKQCSESQFSEGRSGPRFTTKFAQSLRDLDVSVLEFSNQAKNKWEQLCNFLGCIPPTSEFPDFQDFPQRRVSLKSVSDQPALPKTKKLKYDASPWIVPLSGKLQGIRLESDGIDLYGAAKKVAIANQFKDFSSSNWELLDDTFPSNLALFRHDNFSRGDNGSATITLKEERCYVRDYTSASIRSTSSYLYGRFEAVIKPAKGPGLITGLFLQRNSPRQEIDIEILGRNTKQILVNVYYNPGGEGAHYDYGYRGTPALINLGFDAAEDFHRYSIEWFPTSICWFVDSKLVHERVNWNPTPIPHLSMKYYVNLWPCRSKELAGRLPTNSLHACSHIASINLEGGCPHWLELVA